MKKLLLILITSLTSGLGNAQDQPIYFSKPHDLLSAFNDFGANVITIPGGYAFTSLTKKDFLYGNTLAKSDLEGNLVSQKQFLPVTNTISGLDCNAQDSTYLVWGDHYVGNNDYEIYLLKLDWQWDTIWSQSYNPPHTDWVRNLQVLPDKSMLLVCRSLPQPTFVNIIKTDALGNLLWHKSLDYEFNGFHDPWGIELTSDSTVTICFEGGNIYRPYPDTINPTRLFWNGMGLIEMDFNGNIKRDSVYLFTKGTADTSGPSWIKSNGDGILYVTAGREDEVVFNSSDMLHAFDEETWELLWTFRFDEIDPQPPFYIFPDPYLAHFCVNDKGNAVVCGKQYNFQYDVPGSDGESFLPWFAEVSKDGELLWQRWVGWPTICGNVVCDALSSLENIQPTDDGGYILTGQYGLENGTIEAWLLKVDSMGCLEPGCTDRNVLVPVNEPDKNSASSLAIFPNPADALLNLQATSSWPENTRIDLYDFTGQLVLSRVLPSNTNQATIQTGNLPGGLYTYHVFSARDKSMYSGKLVVQH